jgi:hypothetical protein
MGALQQSFLLAEDGTPILAEDGTPLLIEPGGLAIVTEPFVLFSGVMDVMKMSANGQTATIRMRCESKAIKLTSVKERRYTQEDQQLDYAGDTFFDQVSSLQNTEITWGKNVK